MGLFETWESIDCDLGVNLCIDLLAAEADFVVRLGGPADSPLLVHSSYDAFAREFGSEAGLPTDEYSDGSAGFVPVREPVNCGYTVPPTGEEVPFDAVETG